MKCAEVFWDPKEVFEILRFGGWQPGNRKLWKMTKIKEEDKIFFLNFLLK